LDADRRWPDTTDCSIGLRPDACEVVSHYDDRASAPQPTCPAETLVLAGELQRQYSSNGNHYGVVESGNNQITVELSGVDASKRWVQIEVATADLHFFNTQTGRKLSPTSGDSTQ
jgi:hypothetical protein